MTSRKCYETLLVLPEFRLLQEGERRYEEKGV